jgi:formate hydrogenlyase subunit 3/multisubunit Na+/H+ antiporter MnhD subunit
LAAYFAAVILIVATMLSLSYVLGQRHKEPATGSPYESGIVSEGSGFSALTQWDLKRVLAYSTISQVGYMFLALGVGAWLAAICFGERAAVCD